MLLQDKPIHSIICTDYLNTLMKWLTILISICTFPIISSRTRKEKKAVHNELLMHQTYPANPLYNFLNSMLFTRWINRAR